MGCQWNWLRAFGSVRLRPLVTEKKFFLVLEMKSYLITVRKRSLRRLCFYPCLSVILFTGGLLPGVPGPGGAGPGGCVPGGNPPDGYCCGRYASYWNAFLLLCSYFLPKILEISLMKCTIFFFTWNGIQPVLRDFQPMWGEIGKYWKVFEFSHVRFNLSKFKSSLHEVRFNPHDVKLRLITNHQSDSSLLDILYFWCLYRLLLKS